MTPRKSPMFDTATTVGKIMSFLGVSALCGLLAAGLIFPLAASGGAIASAGSDILEDVPAEMREEPLSTPSRFYANDGETLIATFFAENRQPVEGEGISQTMKDAIVSIEDERFFNHGGVDAQGLGRAFINNLTSSGQQGASTLTMQYVNNVLNNAAVVSGEGSQLGAFAQEKTYADKLREMKLAVSVEQEMTKDEILTGYLNIVMLGGQTYGVEAAAQTYWGISADELNVQQSATLAGMVQAPNLYLPTTNPEDTIDRRNVVLGTMLRNDYINQEQYDEAIASDLNLNPEANPPESGCISAEFGNYFCDYVESLITNDPAFGETEADRNTLIARGGLDVVTTLDPELQRSAEAEARAAVPHENSDEDVASSLVSVEPGTGNILAMAQSTEYAPGGEGTSHQTLINYAVGGETGVGQGFPGGSTLKPFVAAAYLEEGGSMDDEIDASRRNYDEDVRWDATCRPSGTTGTDDDYRVTNSPDENYTDMTVDWGLYTSVNTATIATAYDMDLCAITDLTDRLGLQDEAGEGIEPEPANMLGATSLFPLDYTAAYAAFAAEGEYCAPRAIESVTDANGNEYSVPEQNCEQVIDENIVAEVNDTLINIAENQTSLGNGNPPFPMAGKTGTSNTTSATWFQGFTDGIATGAAVMTPGGISDDGLRGLEINGQTRQDVFGSTIAAPMWYAYMSDIGNEYSTDDFPESADSPFEDRRDASRYESPLAGADD